MADISKMVYTQDSIVGCISFEIYFLIEMYKDGKSGKAGRRYNIPMLFGSMQPGLLYNAKADAPLIGLNLYDDPKLDEANITHTDSEVFLENTVIDRMTHFDLGASLALSFMGGLIKVRKI